MKIFFIGDNTMALLKPKHKSERTQVRINIDSEVAKEVGRYCDYAGFKKEDEFFEEAALHILSKDKHFKEWKEKAKQPTEIG